jgi:hypothetical protein
VEDVDGGLIIEQDPRFWDSTALGGIEIDTPALLLLLFVDIGECHTPAIFGFGLVGRALHQKLKTVITLVVEFTIVDTRHEQLLSSHVVVVGWSRFVGVDAGGIRFDAGNSGHEHLLAGGASGCA